MCKLSQIFVLFEQILNRLEEIETQLPGESLADQDDYQSETIPVKAKQGLERRPRPSPIDDFLKYLDEKYNLQEARSYKR